MPNRRRRPLQDEGRKDRKDFRQRAEQSRVQRERIETHRERRERRRETQRSRRQQVDSVRSPKEDLRTERWESRLLPVEDSFLARPVGQPSELPVLIGERWSLSANDTMPSAESVVEFDSAAYTTERNGYPALYTSSPDFSWRIPAGLGGIWHIVVNVTWSAASTAGTRSLQVQPIGGATTYAHIGWDGETQSGTLTVYHKFDEGDEFEITANQDTGGTLDILGGSTHSLSYACLTFAGK